MAKQTLNTIKNWFKTGLKPTQQQFWDTWDSFFHKDEQINANNISGLSALLNDKADKEPVDILLQRANAAPISVQGQELFTLNWDEAKKQIYGDYARSFAVWQQGSLQNVPINFSADENGKPNAYIFTLDNLDTLIFIL